MKTKQNRNPKISFIYLLTFKKESVAILVVDLDSARLGLLTLIVLNFVLFVWVDFFFFCFKHGFTG